MDPEKTDKTKKDEEEVVTEKSICTVDQSAEKSCNQQIKRYSIKGLSVQHIHR